MEARCAFRLDACLERASLKLNTGRLLSRKQVHADTVDVVRVESCIMRKVAGQVSLDLSLGFDSSCKKRDPFRKSVKEGSPSEVNFAP
jgi:hypothetical protein